MNKSQKSTIFISEKSTFQPQLHLTLSLMRNKDHYILPWSSRRRDPYLCGDQVKSWNETVCSFPPFSLLVWLNPSCVKGNRLVSLSLAASHSVLHPQLVLSITTHTKRERSVQKWRLLSLHLYPTFYSPWIVNAQYHKSYIIIRQLFVLLTQVCTHTVKKNRLEAKAHIFCSSRTIEIWIVMSFERSNMT